ncbi:ANTAR domain-containing protein [Geodermatophilus normandii]|uniref:ANTAR domain-containing protein n=1 Tax=Geodermatophilus normandii TaxID=1137989 RepID=A0A317QQX8_9ACTN|nr:ANTAR domain-containing protein [Geodermatophilus normandii]
MAHGLQAALASRAVVDQAKGVLVERHELRPGQAFQLPARASAHATREVPDTADDPVRTGELPVVVPRSRALRRRPVARDRTRSDTPGQPPASPGRPRRSGPVAPERGRRGRPRPPGAGVLPYHRGVGGQPGMTTAVPLTSMPPVPAGTETVSVLGRPMSAPCRTVSRAGTATCPPSRR